MERKAIARRRFLASLALGPLIVREALAACRATERDMLGPYYVPDQPLQEDLCRNAKGERLAITGQVLGLPECRPIPGALVEVWQADGRGSYSLVTPGEKADPECLLRASLKSDAAGRYALRTIVPGVYPGRPRHIHFRVSAPGYRTLVTQLYFRGDGVAGSLAIDLARAADGGRAGAFDLVLSPK